MFLFKIIFAVAASFLAISTLAAPVYNLQDRDANLLERRLTDVSYPDLERRQLSQLQLNQRAGAVMRLQLEKKQAKKDATRQGKKLSKTERTERWKKVTGQGKKAQKARAEKPATKQAKKGAKQQRTKQKKQDVRQQGANAKKSPGKASLEGLTPAEKTKVHKALREAGKAQKGTQNLPGRKDTFVKGQVTHTGKEARIAVFNSHLHASAPLDQKPPNKPGVPKHFGNFKYDVRHPQRGQHPLPGAPSGSNNGLKEFPVVEEAKYKTGYHGGTEKQSARVVHGKHSTVTKDGTVEERKFHGIVTHVGKDWNNHYQMQHVPHKEPEVRYPTESFEKLKVSTRRRS